MSQAHEAEKKSEDSTQFYALYLFLCAVSFAAGLVGLRARGFPIVCVVPTRPFQLKTGK